MWLWRTIGGLLMAGSHLVFALNVWAMRPGPASVTAGSVPLPAEAGA